MKFLFAIFAAILSRVSCVFDGAVAAGIKTYSSGRLPHHYPHVTEFAWDDAAGNLTMSYPGGDAISVFFTGSDGEGYEDRLSKYEKRGKSVVGKADLETVAPRTLYIHRPKAVIVYKTRDGNAAS